MFLEMSKILAEEEASYQLEIAMGANAKRDARRHVHAR
jgi:hypothetical protein